MLRVRSLGASLLAVALLTSLAGCGSDDEGLPPLPSLTATSPAVGTSPTSPAQPTGTPSAAMTEEQAIEAAVRFYYEGYGRAYDTGDADELARGSTEECDCRRAVDVVRDVLADGTVVGGRAAVLRVEAPMVIDNTAVVLVDTDIPDGVLVTRSGTEETLPGPGRSTVTMTLVRPDGENWLVFRIRDAS